MSYAEDVIKQSISDMKLNKSRSRRKSIEKLINYYTGTDTWQYIAGNSGNYFDSQSFNEVPPYGMNLTKKFIDKKSRIYTFSPNRDLGNKSANKMYEDLIEYTQYQKEVIYLVWFRQ